MNEGRERVGQETARKIVRKTVALTVIALFEPDGACVLRLLHNLKHVPSVERTQVSGKVSGDRDGRGILGSIEGANELTDHCRYGNLLTLETADDHPPRTPQATREKNSSARDLPYYDPPEALAQSSPEGGQVQSRETLLCARRFLYGRMRTRGCERRSGRRST